MHSSPRSQRKCLHQALRLYILWRHSTTRSLFFFTFEAIWLRLTQAAWHERTTRRPCVSAGRYIYEPRMICGSLLYMGEATNETWLAIRKRPRRTRSVTGRRQSHSLKMPRAIPRRLRTIRRCRHVFGDKRYLHSSWESWARERDCSFCLRWHA